MSVRYCLHVFQGILYNDPLQTARRKVESQLPSAHTPSVYAALLTPDISFTDGEAEVQGFA